MTATTAPALTAAEQEVVDRFGIFEPEEREAALVETVARAIAGREVVVMGYRERSPMTADGILGTDEARRLASFIAAAIAAYRAAQDDLATRMRDLADNLDHYASKTTGGTYAGGLADAAGHVREVLAGRGVRDGGAEEAVLVEGDWIFPSREALVRDLTKSWADAAQNAGCSAAFVARMRSFADVHDRTYRAALATQAGEGAR